MSDNQDALRLADELLDGMTDEHWNQLNADAAAELRRLHTDNQGLYHAIAAEAKKVVELEALNAELVAECEALREANERFGARQEWWNEKMFEQEERNAELVGALRRIRDLSPYSNEVGDAHAIAHAALAKVEAGNGS